MLLRLDLFYLVF